MPSHIQTANELRETLERKLGELKDNLNADAITLHLYDPQRDRLFFPVGVELLQEERFMRSMPAMERVVGKIVRSRKPIIANDAEHDPDITGPFTHVERVKAAAGFPLVVPSSDEVVGTVFVDYRRAHEFGQDEIERIQAWASDLAEVINQSLEGSQGQALREALRIEADLRLEEVRLQEIVNQLWEVLGDVDVALWTQGRGERTLRVRAGAGLDRDFADRAFVSLATDDANLISTAFAGENEVLVKNPKTDPGATFNVSRPVAWKCMLAIPVSSEHHRLGVLSIFRREQSSFTSREHDLVRAFARLVVVTIENEARIVTLNALHDVGVRLTLATDLQEVLQEVVRSTCQVIGADIA